VLRKSLEEICVERSYLEKCLLILVHALQSYDESITKGNIEFQHLQSKLISRYQLTVSSVLLTTLPQHFSGAWFWSIFLFTFDHIQTSLSINCVFCFTLFPHSLWLPFWTFRTHVMVIFYFFRLWIQIFRITDLSVFCFMQYIQMKAFRSINLVPPTSMLVNGLPSLLNVEILALKESIKEIFGYSWQFNSSLHYWIVSVSWLSILPF